MCGNEDPNKRSQRDLLFEGETRPSDTTKQKPLRLGWIRNRQLTTRCSEPGARTEYESESKPLIYANRR
jgi:hypothetical protein